MCTDVERPMHDEVELLRCKIGGVIHNINRSEKSDV